MMDYWKADRDLAEGGYERACRLLEQFGLSPEAAAVVDWWNEQVAQPVIPEGLNAEYSRRRQAAEDAWRKRIGAVRWPDA